MAAQCDETAHLTARERKARASAKQAGGFAIGSFDAIYGISGRNLLGNLFSLVNTAGIAR